MRPSPANDPFFDAALADLRDDSPPPSRAPKARQETSEPDPPAVPKRRRATPPTPPARPASDLDTDDDDAWFEAVAQGGSGGAGRVVDAAQVADEGPRGAAALPLDGDLIRPARRAARPARTPRSTPRTKARNSAAPPVDPLLADLDEPPTEPPTSRALPGRRTAVRGRRNRGPLLVGGGLLAFAILVVALMGGGSQPEPAKPEAKPAAQATSRPAPRTDPDRSAMGAAADRGDYNTAISLADKLGDVSASQRYRSAGATVLVRRARQAAERGDLALATNRLVTAERRYDVAPGAPAVRQRIKQIQDARNKRAAERKKATARRTAARRRAAAAAAAAATRRRAPRSVSPSNSTPNRTPSPSPSPAPQPTPTPSPAPPSKSGGGSGKSGGSSGGQAVDPGLY